MTARFESWSGGPTFMVVILANFKEALMYLGATMVWVSKTPCWNLGTIEWVLEISRRTLVEMGLGVILARGCDRVSGTLNADYWAPGL